MRDRSGGRARQRTRPVGTEAMDDAVDARQNRVLAALSPRELARLAAQLEFLSVERKHSAYEPHRSIKYVYFPINGVISIVNVMKDGTELEAATVGNEGCVGIAVSLGCSKTATKAFCQVPGISARIRSDVFQRELERNGELKSVVARYTEALITQLARTAACNAVHNIEQRCARWLLQTHDRMGTTPFALTQEFLGGMLGVRRAGVSEACSRLQETGLIRYTRGLVDVLDRKGLERASCECYRAIQSEFDRLLGHTFTKADTRIRRKR
jgi:CRP-like cAMP-binding protein